MMSQAASTVSAPPRWLRIWAKLTVCAALPLLLLGSEVTTRKVGMVDPVGFREPWHLLTASFQDKGLGFLIEHSHRFAGFVVGTCAIVLAIGLWVREPRRWVRWLGVAALAGVSSQGVLGILRVNLNAQVGPELALVHGCVAQLVFALLLAVALTTARSWTHSLAAEEPTALRNWSFLVAGLIYVQGILGAVVRHRDVTFGARLHLLTAFAVVAAVVWLLRLMVDQPTRERRWSVMAVVLAVLLVLQLGLGVESWLAKFPSPEWNQMQPLLVRPDILRSLHYFVGTLLFATSVAVMLHAHRRAAWSVQVEPTPAGRLEGVA